METKTKILIVDDEPINLDFFDVMLSRLGFIVEMAEDGEEALEKVKETNPDLIILDNVMPKLSGWKVTRILKNDVEFESYKDIPIIMFSAMDDVKDKIEGFELGIEDYIIKPFNFSEVLARIRAVLRGRQLSKQVLQKERHIALVESLNKSLIYFTDHLENPILEVSKKAKIIDVTKPSQVEELKKLIVEESDKYLAAVSGLKEEIQELTREQELASYDHKILEDLEAKFQKHFLSLKQSANQTNEVGR